MSIRVRRAVLLAAGAGLIGALPTLAIAQVNRDAVLDILIECSKINDVAARVACYDNNIRPLAQTVAPQVPPQAASSQRETVPIGPTREAEVRRGSEPSPPPRSAPSAASVAGAADVPPRSAPASRVSPTPPAAAAQAIVAEVVERRPGAYLLTLQDGAQWEFAEDVPISYRPPVRGSQVEIERGSLGGYRMRFDGQRAVRVQRVR